jgi:8-oxo-dGTP pyrophosphatase MutT (NUDIX family)
MNPTHAGFIIRCNDYYLICHSSQNRTRILTDNCWSITKGKIDGNESSLETAMRELNEETGYVLGSDDIISQNRRIIKVNDNKFVEVFELIIPEINFDFPFYCESLINNKEHHLHGYPEMDGFMWVNKELARKLVFKSQKCLFD